MSSNSDLLTSLDVMYEAANRRAEAAEWRDDYATGYCDGLWDARTRVREAVYDKGLVLHTRATNEYDELNVGLQTVRDLYVSVEDQYRRLEGEMNGLIRLIDKIRELADFGLDETAHVDPAVEALIEIIRLLDGGDA